MRVPSVHVADAIQTYDTKVEINNRWWLARPEPYYHWTRRWSLAWMVFTGKTDALKWVDQC